MKNYKDSSRNLKDLFKGKVCEVQLTALRNDNDALGYFGRTSVYVRNGRQAFEENKYSSCLVRFNFKSYGDFIPATHFLTRDSSKVWRGSLLSEKKYILLGEFLEENNDIPTIKQLNKFYDPGNMPQVYFFNSLNDYYDVDFLSGIAKSSMPISQLVRFDKEMQIGKTKAFIFRDRKDMDKISKISIENRLIPIVMEPLSSFD